MPEQVFTPPEGTMGLPALPPGLVWVVRAETARLAGIVDETTGEMRFAAPSKAEIMDAVLRAWASHALRQAGMTLEDLEVLST